MQQSPNELGAKLEQMNRLLGAMTAVVWSPRYEYSPVLTVGGPTGKYNLQPFWPTLCEYCLLSVIANEAATVILSTAPNPAPPADTATLDPSRQDAQQVAVTAAAGTLAYGGNAWQPLPAQGWLYLATTVANSKAAYVSIQYRRRINPAGIPAE